MPRELLQTAPADLPPPENRVYYPALDGLRALAVLLVFSAHYLRLPQALYWGRAGVDAFFVLSGFLITGILFDSASHPGRFRIFYTRRALRIFPLYYLVLLLPVLLDPLFSWRLHPGQWLWPAYLGNYAPLLWQGDAAANDAPFLILHSTRTSLGSFAWNLDHLWSLCVEEQFYLLWPPIVFLVRDRRRLLGLCITTVVLAPLARWACLHWAQPGTIEHGLLYLATPLRADALMLGGALALLLRGAYAARLSRLARPSAWVLVAIFASWQIASLRMTGHLIDPIWSSLHNPLYATFNSLAAAAILLLSLAPHRRLAVLLCGRPLRWLGQRSYGVYVYHVLLFSEFAALARWLCRGHRGIAGALLPLIALVGAVVVAALSYRFFEAPLLRLKARLA